jgi:hypothetical protein
MRVQATFQQIFTFTRSREWNLKLNIQYSGEKPFQSAHNFNSQRSKKSFARKW